MDNKNDKRTASRFRHETRVVFEKENSGKYFVGRMLNCSVGGMYIESEFVAQPGTEIFLSLEKSPYRINPDFYHGKISWSRQLSHRDKKTSFGIGVKLQKPVKIGTAHMNVG